jgi:arylsulfatase A-like enzyme/PKD repeat protein
VLIVVAVTVAVGTVRGSSGAAHASTRPNVVVVEVDDMRADEMQYMTQTLALLRGTTFTRSYVSTSLCCPSRAAFLSGQYTQNNSVWNNNGAQYFNNKNTVATWLHDSGYFTSILGKYLNGYGCASPTPPGWDHWQALCANIYSMFKYSIKDNAATVTFGTGAANYQTDVLAQRASATIDEGAASGKPFFLWVTPTAPHSGPGQRVAARYAKTLSTYTLPPSPARNEADVTDKPAWVQKLKPNTKSQAWSVTLNERNRIRMLFAADDLVAKVVNELTTTGQLDNTVIVFTSDNGFMTGEHRVLSGKEIEYEPSLSVPLLISGPGFPVANNDNLVMNTDLAPTIAALAGVTPGRVEDGRSLLPIVAGTADWSKRAIRHWITADNTIDGSPPHPSGDGIRAGNYAYFQLSTGERELYDHAADPYELQNVAGQPKYKSLQAQLASMLTTLKTCAGASCQMDLGNIAPTAAATGNCVSLVCTFGGSGSNDLDGTIASYAWNFGDGTTGSGVSPTHTYAASGTHTVVLTVTDNQGATATDSVAVTGTAANIPPTASFTSSCTDLSCSFDGTASNDPDGTIVSYAWDFGDHTTATLPTLSHDYNRGGTYTVSLTVTDNRGGTNTTTSTVTVTPPNVPPVAHFTHVCVGSTCTFDGTSSTDSDGTVVSYSWDFGDGLTSTDPAPTHTYADPGVYAVTLIVTDNRGGTGTLVLSVGV